MTATTALPDLTSYRAVHHAIRLAARRLSAAAGDTSPADTRRVDALRRYWAGYSAEVLVHHTIEDENFFPALAARSSVMVELMQRLDSEHHQLDELMADAADAITSFASPARAAAALARLADLMDAHLDLEDEQVLPLFTAHFTGAEFDELEVHARKAIGVGEQAAFTIPFIVASMDDATREHVLGTAPLPMRVLHRLTRRSHAKLDAAVFAGAPVLTVGRQAVVS